MLYVFPWLLEGCILDLSDCVQQKGNASQGIKHALSRPCSKTHCFDNIDNESNSVGQTNRNN